MWNLRKLFALCICLTATVTLCAGCFSASGKDASSVSIKTDISAPQASEAAQGIVKQAQQTLSDAETVYLHAFPEMARRYGKTVMEFEAEQYFLNYARILQEDQSVMPTDEAVLAAMDGIGLSVENGTFNMENYTAGMSRELMEVPAAMLNAIRNYDTSSQGENSELDAAYRAYQDYLQ
ncbi:MAG: hypothetical protein VB082_03635 [Christensenella sp.]|nr:hypothetical protein [Christensenella sp.]